MENNFLNIKLTNYTIIIITFNRYPFLLRLLKFYDNYDHDFHFLILDSSNDELDDELKSYLDRENLSYNKYDSSIFFADKIAEGCTHITTPFSVLCADDDFLIPSGIQASKNYLLEHTDYASVHGLYYYHSYFEKFIKHSNPTLRRHACV